MADVPDTSAIRAALDCAMSHEGEPLLDGETFREGCPACVALAAFDAFMAEHASLAARLEAAETEIAGLRHAETSWISTASQNLVRANRAEAALGAALAERDAANEDARGSKEAFADLSAWSQEVDDASRMSDNTAIGEVLAVYMEIRTLTEQGYSCDLVDEVRGIEASLGAAREALRAIAEIPSRRDLLTNAVAKAMHYIAVAARGIEQE